MSTLEGNLGQLSKRLDNLGKSIQTEEATKTALVLPFLQALGFDVFDPMEVIPEFTADIVGKKGEKVDYAIRIQDDICILVECKSIGTPLDRKHLSQLYRYFSVTKAKFAILTNGCVFEFYTDLDEPNKLDGRPFFIFDLKDLNVVSIAELRKFEKSSFDVGRILANAERLKFVSSIKRFLAAEFEDPKDDLVRLVAANVYEGRVTSQVRETVASCIKFAFRELVRESVQSKLSSALASNEEVEAPSTEQQKDEVVTTREEIEGFLTIKSIVRDIVPSKRVHMRDAKSYCAVLVDDNNRKPLARMHFNRKQWYLGLFDGEQEERIPIADLEAIFEFAERLRATARRYVEQ